jgi:microcompartment protein CcmK/EutM
MRLGKTIGTVTLVEPHPTMRGGALRLVVPLTTADLARGDGPAEPLVAWDDLNAGDGQLVAFSEGGEAFAAQSWLRLPPGSRLRAHTGDQGASVWVKLHHLSDMPSPPSP